MSEPRVPHEAELLALDAQLDLLAAGGTAPHDPVLTALSALAREVDQRTALLLGNPDPPTALLPVELTDEPPATLRRPGRTRTRRARHRRGRWVALPLAAGLALTSVGTAAALSSSPHEPLYPLHTLLFGGPTAASRVDADLAAASKDLAAFATAQESSRPRLVTDATRRLHAAQLLVGQVQDPAERSRLTGLIASLSLRVTALSGADVEGDQPVPGSSPSPEDLSPEPSDSETGDSPGGD